MSSINALVEAVVSVENIEIILAYFCAIFLIRKWQFLALFILTIVVCLFPDSFFAANSSVINTYLLISIVYCFACVMLVYSKDYLPALAVTFMSMYCLYFAFDTWTNPNESTWIYINHEGIVLSLHAVVLLSFSKKLSSLVASCVDYLYTFFNNNESDHASNSRVEGRKGEAQNR